uniref:Uncharacterized protein n=1 Tax=Arundo donax TaxID=35708 RepID=A0A0A9CZN4_ARUDO
MGQVLLINRQVIHAVTSRPVREEQRLILARRHHRSPNLNAELQWRVQSTKQRILQLPHLLFLFVLLGLQHLSPRFLPCIIAIPRLGFLPNLCTNSYGRANTLVISIISGAFLQMMLLERVPRYQAHLAWRIALGDGGQDCWTAGGSRAGPASRRGGAAAGGRICGLQAGARRRHARRVASTRRRARP